MFNGCGFLIKVAVSTGFTEIIHFLKKTKIVLKYEPYRRCNALDKQHTNQTHDTIMSLTLKHFE